MRIMIAVLAIACPALPFGAAAQPAGTFPTPRPGWAAPPDQPRPGWAPPPDAPRPSWGSPLSNQYYTNQSYTNQRRHCRWVDDLYGSRRVCDH